MSDILDDPERMKRIASGLVDAALMSADDLAAKKGEDNLFVQIKRNHERLNGCDGHEFEPMLDWRQRLPFSLREVRCNRCSGMMKAHDVMLYLRGRAHERGVALSELSDPIFPKDTPK